MGFNIGDKIIFINNNPRYISTDNRLRGKIGVILEIDDSADETEGDQSLCVNWKINGMDSWWTMSTDVRLAKLSELS
jgi:ATP-dependent exoDNAse (exonuclease V) alpha subunit